MRTYYSIMQPNTTNYRVKNTLEFNHHPSVVVSTQDCLKHLSSVKEVIHC